METLLPEAPPGLPLLPRAPSSRPAPSAAMIPQLLTRGSAASPTAAAIDEGGESQQQPQRLTAKTPANQENAGRTEKAVTGAVETAAYAEEISAYRTEALAYAEAHRESLGRGELWLFPNEAEQLEKVRRAPANHLAA